MSSAIHLARQLDPLLPVPLRGLQVVPFVGDTRQAKMRFGGKPPRRIAYQLQDPLVGLLRQQQLGVQFLDLAQTECRGGGVDGIANGALPRMTSAYAWLAAARSPWSCWAYPSV